MREHAQYFRGFCGARENRGLLGGETVHANSRAPFTDQEVSADYLRCDIDRSLDLLLKDARRIQG